MTLELHAKTYYNNPHMHGGDEHYIGVPDMRGKELGHIVYSGTGWQMIRGSVHNHARPLGGYLNIFVVLGKCKYTAMRQAELTLSCSLGYWGGPPNSGIRSVDWNAKISNTKYSITRVSH